MVKLKLARVRLRAFSAFISETFKQFISKGPRIYDLPRGIFFGTGILHTPWVSCLPAPPSEIIILVADAPTLGLRSLGS